MKSDIRISCNTEIPQPTDNFDVNKPHKSVRIKERSTFQFKWIRLDFTVTQMQLEGRVNSNLEYEVEIEISDMKYVVSNMDKTEDFKSIIRRYLQNVFGITKMMMECGNEIE